MINNVAAEKFPFAAFFFLEKIADFSRICNFALQSVLVTQILFSTKSTNLHYQQ